MPRRVEFVPCRPKTILNKGKRADHWFWIRYTAYPYKGCMHGCEFCYRLPCVQVDNYLSVFHGYHQWRYVMQEASYGR